MKFFLVKIGRRTRGGNFQELHSRAVAVADEANYHDIQRYFVPRYKGFDVIIEQPEYEDIPDMPIKDVNPGKSKTESEYKHGVISNFKVEYTEAEEQLYKEYDKLRNKAEELLRWLHDSIINRYEKLPYVRMTGNIELETTYGYCGGTYCKRLPVRSSDFFKVIKNGDDGMAELKIVSSIPDPDSDDPGIPF